MSRWNSNRKSRRLSDPTGASSISRTKVTSSGTAADVASDELLPPPVGGRAHRSESLESDWHRGEWEWQALDDFAIVTSTLHGAFDH